MILSDLAGRRVVVLGVGIDVAAVLPRVVAVGPAEVVVVDADPARAGSALGGLGLGEIPVLTSLEEAPPADVALRSPGFSPYQPAVQRRTAGGMATVTPLGLWLCERGERPAVAITGTKGKSSTSVLTHVALGHLGVPAVVLGNIGVPPWEHPPEMPETAVLEISSYQAADLPLTAPVAALTAVGEDHVGWHGSVERYQRDKARVFRAPTPDGRRWCAVPTGVDLPSAFAGIEFTRVAVPAGDLRASNAGLAAAVALAATGGEQAAASELAGDLLARYPDLPGRFATIATVDGVEYVDDALASNPLGQAAALRSLEGRPVTVIVGGADRGASIEPVRAALAARAAPILVCCIDDAAALADQYRSTAGGWVPPEGGGDRPEAVAVDVEVADDLEAAVALAATRTPAGGAVLFSPGMPTPTGQGSWAQRSARFRAAVERLG